MASKSRKLMLGFVCLLLFLGPSSQLDRLLQGQELKDGDELISAHGKFKLGFFNLTSNNYYLGIWLNDNYTRLQNLVWVANRDAPIFNNSGSLTIDDYGNLKISYNGSLSIVLYSGQEASNASAVLLDTGNFVLRETSSERQLWQSFDYPTHALVPGMRLGVNRKTGHTWSLTSWRGELVPAVGSFTLGLEPNLKDRLVILWRESLYWTSPNVHFGSTYTGLNCYGYHFSYISNMNETYLNYIDLVEYYRDGVEYYRTGVIRPLMIDYFGRLSNEFDTVVDCNSTVLDLSDRYNLSWGFVGCKAQCRSHDDTFTPVSSSMKDGFKFDESDNLTRKDCEAKCFHNCSCVAYASTNQDAQTGCEIWSTLDRLIGFSNPNARTIYFLASALAKIKENRKTNRSQVTKWWIWLIMVVWGIIITFFCFLFYARWKKHRVEGERKKKQKMLIKELGGNVKASTVNGEENQQNNDEKIFSFESICAATSNFSIENKLGEGGFGPVYKGILPNGQEIAIKRLSRCSGQGLVEFKNEAILITKLQHTNLVKLLGFCIQDEEKILIYEYMLNKSLDFFLFDSTKKHLLNWKKRFNIIEGIAQGLVYLHKYSRLRVIHRDLKTSNILLDEEMNPKISDFGMAKIFGIKEIEGNTSRVVGTYGYMAPEYARNGLISMKTDVFSYGVLLLEIVSGKKNNSRFHFDYSLNLIGYAWQLWNEDKGMELIDSTILDESCPASEVLKCIHVGLLCVQEHATNRPTMLEVVSFLVNENLQLSPPKKPAFYINTVVKELEVFEIKPENCSINNVTVSEMEAR